MCVWALRGVSLDWREGEGGGPTVQENKGFAEQRQEHVDLDYGFEVGVVQAALDAACGACDDDHECVSGGAVAGHWFVRGGRAAGVVAQVVEFADRGVAAEVGGEEGGGVGVVGCEAGEGLFGGGDERGEGGVEGGEGRVRGRFDEAVGDEDAEDFLDLGGGVGARVVEERGAVVLRVCEEVVGVFLGVLAFGRMVGGKNIPVRC